MARGAVRRGEALLAGLMRCGHCGRRLHVSYSGTDGFCVRYNCRGSPSQSWDRALHLVRRHPGRCRRGGGSARVILAPLGIEARPAGDRGAARAMLRSERRQTELALTQARYEAELARRQYDRIDPDNRLVAAELERRWNDRLVEVLSHWRSELIGSGGSGSGA